MNDNGLTGFGGATPHGTEKKYRQGCRCDECRAARAAEGKRYRAQAAEWPVAAPHGTTRGYCHYGCHCDACKAAKSETDRIAYQKKLAFRETLAQLRERGSAS